MSESGSVSRRFAHARPARRAEFDITWLALTERATTGLQWLVLLLAAALLTGAGCSRDRYRIRADQEVYALVDTVASDPRWPLDDYTILVDPRSRLFDPTDPDHPPMPPDDPTAHRLMHNVDGMKGWPHWHDNGDLNTVDFRRWPAYLPFDANGEVPLDRETAVRLALLHSRQYQQNLETLYLSALDVTFERFRFDVQFFGGNSTFYTADGRVRGGGESLSVLQTNNDFQINKLNPLGGELVVGLANSIVWQFAGPDTNQHTSILNFNLIQPLLRAGGRARVLERLTISERALLANVRQMERYRRGFYIETVTGRDSGPGPSRRGGFFGASGLEGFTGVGGGGFGRVGGTAAGGGGAGGVTGGAGAAQAGGFLGLLQDQQQIRNQEANLAALGDSLAQLEASYEAGRIDRFQVDLARQALFNTQSQLLNRQIAYQNSLDNFKIRIGLPPDVPMRVEDDLLRPFELIDPDFTLTQNYTTDLLNEVRDPQLAPDAEKIAEFAQRAAQLRGRVEAQLAAVRQDFENLKANADERRAWLERIRRRGADGDASKRLVESPAEFDARLKQLQVDYKRLVARFEHTWSMAKGFDDATADTPADLARRDLILMLTDLSNQLLELSLIQARARLDSVVLELVEIDPSEALEIARANRLDWMNARASLVDTWRLIEFNANALKSNLDVVFNGDIATLGNNPARFRSPTGRLQVGLQFDAPLTRVAERNVYRQALIEYQQARRSYMQFEDQVYQTLRSEIRQIELNQLNFELRREAVQVAINQVDLARLRLNQPPRPGETEQFSVTTARDLVSALSDLLNVQNDFLSVWVNYEVQRMNLDFDLGTMQLDDRGLWIDPGPILGYGLDGRPSDLELFPELLIPAEGLEVVPPGAPVEESLPQPAFEAASASNSTAPDRETIPPRKERPAAIVAPSSPTYSHRRRRGDPVTNESGEMVRKATEHVEPGGVRFVE